MLTKINNVVYVKQMAAIGATTSSTSSDQQQASTEGFQLICDP